MRRDIAPVSIANYEDATIPLVALYLVTVLLRLLLVGLNIQHRRKHGDEVPPELAGSIDRAALQRSLAYTSAGERLSLLRLVVMAGVTVAFLFGGILESYDGWITSMAGRGVWSGVLFFVGLHLASTLIELPFDAYATFRIEQRYGFNRSSVGLFLSDLGKSTLLGIVLVSAVSAVGLWLLRAVPEWYWLIFWAFAVALMVLLMLISPYVIEPLFIKTKPLANEGLAEAVRRLADQAGVQVSQVLEVDASRRTAHSNAYFTGIGRTKRVVMYDTLLARITDAELLAVLGHELGHWKLRHVSTRLLTVAGLALVGLWLAARLLAWDGFAAWTGIPGGSVPAQIVMLGFLGGIVGFVSTPLSAFSSRRHEWQADAFATKLTGRPHDLASALVKLASDNLSNLPPHPLFAGFYYSHPPVTERIRGLVGTTPG